MDEYEHQYYGDKLAGNVPYRDIRILLKSRIKPCNAQGVEYNRNAGYGEQCFVLIEPVNGKEQYKNTAYVIAEVIRFIIISSCAVFVSFSRSSRTLAHARIPYVGIPSEANMVKYEITDVAKFTFPIPSTKRVREIYGNVISGKINEETVSMAFIMKLN